MKKIKQIKISALRNAEFIQYFTEAMTIMERRDPAALGVSTEWLRLRTLVSRAEALLRNRRSHVLSERLMTLDARREQALLGLRRMVEGYRLSPAPAEQTAAGLLYNYLQSFGSNISRDNYQGQTTLVRRLTTDLTQDASLSAAIALLGLQGRVIELSAANQLFADDYLARAEDQGQYSPESVQMLRGEITEAWTGLREMLYSNHVVHRGAEPWGTATKALNGLTDYYASLLARRQRGGVSQPGDNLSAEELAEDSTDG